MVASLPVIHEHILCGIEPHLGVKKPRYKLYGKQICCPDWSSLILDYLSHTYLTLWKVPCIYGDEREF